MALSISQKINIAKLSQMLATVDIIKRGLFGGGVNLQLPRLIYMIRKNVEWLYDLDPTDTSLVSTSDYLYALCAPYSLKAQIILNGGGTGTAVIAQQSTYVYEEIAVNVNGASGQPIAGTYTFTHADLIGATDLKFIVVNNTTETIGNGDFTFNNVTGTITRVNQWQTGDTGVIPFNKLV